MVKGSSAREIWVTFLRVLPQTIQRKGCAGFLEGDEGAFFSSHVFQHRAQYKNTEQRRPQPAPTAYQTWAILLGGVLVLGDIGVLLKIGIGYC